MTRPLLEVEELSTCLELPDRTVYAVDQVSFTVGAGETVGLVGESGSGKTLTGASIIRLLPDSGRISSGAIRLDGRDLATISEKEMRSVRGDDIAMVFQDPMICLNPTMTIGLQVGESLRIHRHMDKAAERARVLELLDLVGVPAPSERIDAYPHQLSGGLRQRVSIAMALACEPKLLIADEPTTALDVSIQEQILLLLERLKSKLGMAILLITHDMGVISGYADRVLVMYAGRIVESAPTAELFRHPRHRYTEALLDSVPKIDQDQDTLLYSIPGRPPELTSLTPHCRFAERCRFADELCRDSQPPMVDVPGGGSHACYHPRPELGEAATPHSGPERTLGREVQTLVQIDNVVKEFPVVGRGLRQRSLGTVKAVSGVTLEVRQGETLGVVGESGCGKTTLGRMMVGLERPDSGSIAMDGIDLAQLRGRELRQQFRDRQMIFQDPYASLDPRMRVGPILGEPMAIQHLYGRAEREQRILELLADVGLDEAAVGLFPREFSGGQRQRIGFARALALKPKLIVADEPVSALDVSIRSQVLNLMRRLQAEHDLTYVLISHDLSVVRYLADRVAVMYLGKLVEIGPCASVYERTAHPYTFGLLRAIPVTDPGRARRRDREAVPGELPSAMHPPSGCRFRTRCPRAQERCGVEEPILSAVGGTGHLAACHFPLTDASS